MSISFRGHDIVDGVCVSVWPFLLQIRAKVSLSEICCLRLTENEICCLRLTENDVTGAVDWGPAGDWVVS